MTRTALALSPHLDDAVFSCGGTLARLAALGWRVVVATLFTRSVPDPQGFALACQLDKGLGPEVDYMALRRDEDRVAMRALGAEPLHVALPEAPHRGYGSAADLFRPPRADDLIGQELGLALAALVADHHPDILLAPQGIGGHVDHVQLIRALPALERPVAWWRDFPYTARGAEPAEPFRDRMSALPLAAVSLDATFLAARELACLAYATQLGFQFGGAAGLHAKLAQAGPIELFRLSSPPPAELGTLFEPLS